MQLSSSKLGITLFLVLGSLHCLATVIPEHIKESALFVYVAGPNGQLVPNGTCFLVFVPYKNETQKGAGYLVTAKHVLQNPNHDFYPNISVRVNKKTEGVENLTVLLHMTGPDKNVFVHNDPTVDIAVVRVPMLDPTRYTLSALSIDLLPTREDVAQLNITEGSDVFFTGLFMPYLGKAKNQPIVRFGRVALLTDEKIDWEGTPTTLYLIETFTFGGNSGAPVFFYTAPETLSPTSVTFSPPVFKLAGVMEGYFGEGTPIAAVETNLLAVSRTNLGIAAVTPSYLLRDILFSKEVVDDREAVR